MTSEFGCESVSISKAEEQPRWSACALGEGGGQHNRQTDRHTEGGERKREIQTVHE